MKRPRSRVAALAGATAVSLALAAPTPAFACSMCRCDDPAHTLAGEPMLRQHSWRITFEAERFAKDQVSVEDPSRREGETELRYTAGAAWTPAHRVTLRARAAVSDRTLTAGAERTTRAGVSDPELSANLELMHTSGAHPLWIAAHAGARLPAGSNDLELGGVRLEEHLQPGAGAAGGFAGLGAVQSLGEHDALYAGVTGRWNGTNSHGYRYGGALVAHAGWQHEVRPWLEAGPELDYRSARHDLDAGERDPNTGGAVLYVTPRAELRISERLGLRLGVQVPVVSALYGDQHEKVNVQTGLVLRR